MNNVYVEYNYERDVPMTSRLIFSGLVAIAAVLSFYSLFVPIFIPVALLFIILGYYYHKSFNSEYEYMIRFGVVSLLQFYLDDNFRVDELEIVKNIKSDYFYVKMAIAWFYSFALIKQYDSTIEYFLDKKLDKWIHNKAIQKAIESYRISDDKKEFLRSLKIK